MNSRWILTNIERPNLYFLKPQKILIKSQLNLRFVYIAIKLLVIKNLYHFQTFCSYCLGAHDRYLLPANTSLGVLNYKGRYFAFSSKEAADVFASDPEKYTNYKFPGKQCDVFLGTFLW